MKLSDCITDYLSHLRHEQGAALTTFKGYQAWLHNLQRFVLESGYEEATIDAFNTGVLRRYLYHLSGRGLRPRTRQRPTQTYERLRRRIARG